MDPEYSRLYRDLHEHHWWWRAREAMIVELLRRLSPENGFGSILDVGCGDGLFLEHLQEFGTPGGLEPDQEIVSEETLRRWNIYLCPFDNHFVPDERYGLILMLDVLEHLADDDAALRRAAALLAPGGTLLLTVPAFRMLWTSHDDLNYHERRYTRATMFRALESTSLEILSLRYFFNWLFPVKLMIRAKEHVFGPQASPPRVPSKLLNLIYHSLCRCEQNLWGRLPLPFGSSLLAVGRSAR